ncbi:DEAD/DEAH-box helicase, partial [Rhizoctonia solani AG-3 Rhs1AP]
MSTSASGSAQSSNPPGDPATADMRKRLIEETLKRTNGEKRPHDWQLKVALDMLAGHDTLTIAGTGSGKTLPFVMPAFVLEKAIIWILAPLNYIQEQQVKDFESMGLSAVCVNQNTRWKEAKRDILCGKYQVVISSPEAFLDVDKLRGVLLSEELTTYRQFVVVDEAHVIQTWGGEFRVAYQRVGDLRAALHGVPFSAATATATEEIKNAIITSLHLVHQMTGGAESYKEITHLFPDPTNIKKTLIFTDSVEQAKCLVHELRQHFKLTGDDRYRVRAYFANRAESGKIGTAEAFKAGQCDILVTTEALTMGCDFADVELVIQYTAPDSTVTHCQRTGREDELLGNIEVQDGNATEDEAEVATYLRKPKSRRFGLDVARFIMAENCYIKILDDIFNNPEHISCYEAGTCSLCVARRVRDESAGSIDIQGLDRAVKREQLDQAMASEEEDDTNRDERTSNRRKAPSIQLYRRGTTAAEEFCVMRITVKRVITATCLEICNIQALDAIARSRQVVELASLEYLKPPWPRRAEWGEEVLVALEDLHKEIESERKVKHAKRTEDRAREKEAKKEAARQQELDNMRRREAELVAQRRLQGAAPPVTPMRPITRTYELPHNAPRPPPFVRHPGPRSQPPLMQATPPAPVQLRVPPQQQLTPPENLPPNRLHQWYLDLHQWHTTAT